MNDYVLKYLNSCQNVNDLIIKTKRRNVYKNLVYKFFVPPFRAVCSASCGYSFLINFILFDRNSNPIPQLGF